MRRPYILGLWIEGAGWAQHREEDGKRRENIRNHKIHKSRAYSFVVLVKPNARRLVRRRGMFIGPRTFHFSRQEIPNIQLYFHIKNMTFRY